MLFCYLGSFRRCRKNESEDEFEGLAALFSWAWTEFVDTWIKLWQICLLFTRSVTRAVIELITQSITQVAAIRACENKSGRYQCFFNRFNPVRCRLKELSNQTNRKLFFVNRTRNNSTNPTNLKRLIPKEHDL